MSLSTLTARTTRLALSSIKWDVCQKMEDRKSSIYIRLGRKGYPQTLELHFEESRLTSLRFANQEAGLIFFAEGAAALSLWGVVNMENSVSRGIVLFVED